MKGLNLQYPPPITIFVFFNLKSFLCTREKSSEQIKYGKKLNHSRIACQGKNHQQIFG